MSEDDRLNVAVVIGSTRRGRFGPTPARWIADQAEQRGGMKVDLIDLAEADLPPILPSDDATLPLPEQVEALAPRIEAADAFIVVTPVYNRGYPGSVKNAIDWFFTEWQAKAVGFVSYGGVTGGLTSIEQLRPIFNELNAATIRNTITFPDYQDKFDELGQPTNPELLSSLAKGFLEQLTWWAEALREARRKVPYPG
ncbi:FMN reductase [Nocardiopsis kunsanensis]|uniref:FMN reductase n=1 Tax=Nocardiopsis kunsanensis TaxID=141693 RepID=A0A919CFA9_9ACTN|nr:NAD(P)H-dependent oxidoreductase [Nocardiopsis kunsanensis]GHD17735.1 FMN reductase [Nocardiopsis kunsanensis]